MIGASLNGSDQRAADKRRESMFIHMYRYIDDGMKRIDGNSRIRVWIVYITIIHNICCVWLHMSVCESCANLQIIYAAARH